MNLKDFGELKLGFSDAQMFVKRYNKEFFNQIFVKRSYLDRIIDPDKYFVVGEKGTGKTAFAVYLSNNTHFDVSSRLTFINETGYEQFVLLKEKYNLVLSDFTTIWRIILSLLLCDKIATDPKEKSIFGHSRFLNVKKAIDEYYSMSFAPEISEAMRLVDKSETVASILAKHSGEEQAIADFDSLKFRKNLNYIQAKFEDALSSAKLQNDHIVFIDGIDIRPSSIDYQTYLECIKGLANAVWSLNNNFLGNIKGSKGKLKVVLLVRPDIFHSMGLQNQNAKLRDNSVYLDWRVVYDEYRESFLFEMADRLLAADQELKLAHGQAWDYYFPYRRHSTVRHRNFDHSFITILRFSFYRPRDIITMLKELQDIYTFKGKKNYLFQEQDFLFPRFRNNYSTYLLGEIRDYLKFYHSEMDFEYFLKFFQYLKGKTRFNYEDFISAFGEIQEFISRNKIDTPLFFASSDAFLQFLYDMNVISYIEDSAYSSEAFISWAFRERTLSNIAPKVRSGVRYEIHYGLANALRIGQTVR